jgi:cytochrome P450
MRTAAADAELGGQHIREGDALLICFASGNQDEAVHADPDAFRIDRAPGAQLGFGSGVHACLGLHLAKLEIGALLGEVLDRLTDIRLTGEPEYYLSTTVQGLRRLPIGFAARG